MRKVESGQKSSEEKKPEVKPQDDKFWPYLTVKQKKRYANYILVLSIIGLLFGVIPGIPLVLLYLKWREGLSSKFLTWYLMFIFSLFLVLIFFSCAGFMFVGL